MRSKPDFQPDSSRSQNKGSYCPSCLWILFVSIGGYFVFTAINRVLSGQGNNLDHMICYGVLIGLAILILLAKYQEKQDKIKLKKARQEWKRKCKSVEVAIINRHYSPGRSWEDEYGIPHSSHSRRELNLELTTEQRTLIPNLQSVNVTVNIYVYARLLESNVVRIYYQPASPLVFLLEEELE